MFYRCCQFFHRFELNSNCLIFFTQKVVVFPYWCNLIGHTIRYDNRDGAPTMVLPKDEKRVKLYSHEDQTDFSVKIFISRIGDYKRHLWLSQHRRNWCGRRFCAFCQRAMGWTVGNRWEFLRKKGADCIAFPDSTSRDDHILRFVVGCKRHRILPG